jgi:hypothetical protein
MVVPVPVVLQKEQVKTLPHDVFDRVDQLSAPRLVEYWEQDPCYVEPVPRMDDARWWRPARALGDPAIRRRTTGSRSRPSSRRVSTRW